MPAPNAISFEKLTRIIGTPRCRVALRGEMTNPTKSMVMLCC